MEEDPPFDEVDRVGENRFEELKQIAEGGCAFVYKTKELIDTKRVVAIKLVQCRHADLAKGKPSIISRFREEVRTWNEFATSRNVVRLYYTFRQKTRPPEEWYFLGFVMEYSELGDLSKNIAQRQLYAARRKDLYSFLRRIAVAIKEGHDKDITHGDIKPHNVLLFRSDGSVIPKVMDFGMGISASMDISVYGGTPEYLAPERFGSELSFSKPANVAEAKASDVYALGILFYEIICGHRPHISDSSLPGQQRWGECGKLHREGMKVAAVEELEQRGGRELAELVRKMTSIDVEYRPHMLDIVRRLNRMQQDASMLTRREEDDCPIAKRTYRWNPHVHRVLGSRLYYYLIKGRSVDGDPKWFKNQLDERGVRYYSFYRILGGYDYILRVWVKTHYAEQLDQLVEMFKSQQRTDFMRFAVEHSSPCYDHESLSFPSESALLAEVERCANVNKQAEYRSLREKNLVGGRLQDAEKDSIRVFITVMVGGATNEPLLRMYSDEIKRHLVQLPLARDVSIYRGGGNFQILIKFRLQRFQDFRTLYAAFLAACEYVRVGDSVINSQTYIELDERGVVESDDGSIIGDLISRLDQGDQPQDA